MEQVEPKVADIAPDFALGPKNPFGAVRFLKGAGSMMAGIVPGQVLVPMDSNLLGAVLVVGLGLLGSKEAELGLEIEKEAMC